MLLTVASRIFEKLMPSFQKDSFDTPSSQLKSMINSVDTHFESFEKFVEEKVQHEFNTKRLQNLKKMIANDKVTLDTCVKSMQEALSEGGNLYKSCLSLKRFTKDFEKNSKEHEDELACISQSVDPLLVSL